MDQFSHDPFSAEQSDDSARQRHETRDSLFLMADMRIGDSPTALSVRVRNLSAGGLMAEYAPGLSQGSVVQFDVRGIGWLSGKVAWCAAGRIGIAFDRMIDPMLARKPVGTAPKAPSYVSPLINGR